MTVFLEPDSELQARWDKEEKEKLAAIQAKLSDEQIDDIVATTHKLKELQAAPDDPEALAAIPRLTLADLEEENKNIPIAISQANGAEILYHDLFTNGIVYLEAGFNAHVLPADLLPYVKLFGRALVEIGTESEDFVKLQQRIGAKTGGVYPSTFISAKREADDAAAWLFLRGKSTVAQVDDLLGIMRDVFLTVQLDNQERFKQMVLRAKSGVESGLIPSGHSVVNRRLRSYFSESGWLGEKTGGVDYLYFLRQLAEDVENDWPSVLAKLEALRDLLVNRNAMLCNVTLDAANWAIVEPKLRQFIDQFPASDVNIQTWDWQRPLTAEGLTIPAQVNYVAKGANLYDLGYKRSGTITPITNYLRTTYLWEKIRVQGGAYGGLLSFSSSTGVFSYLSYRDPNLLKTVENYDNAGQFLRRDISEDELVKSIIGSISGLDSYQLPDAKGFSSLSRYLTNTTDEYRQQVRDEVLSTTAADFAQLADVLDQLKENGLVTVLGSAEAIAAANAEKGGDWLEVSKVM